MGIAVFYVLRATLPVWSAFVIAIILADLLHPVLRFFSRQGNHVLGMALLLLAIVLIILSVVLLGFYISSQINRFSLVLPVINSTLEEGPYQIARLLDPNFDTLFEQVYINLKRLEASVGEQVTDLLNRNSNRGISRLASSGGQIGIIVVLTLYLLNSFSKYTHALTAFIPSRFRENITGFVAKFAFAMGGYIKGQLLVGLATGILVTLAMMLIGVPLAPVLGIVYGVANFIPYFGPIVAAVPTVIFAFLEGVPTVILAVLALVVVSQIDGNLLSPFIFSKFISLDPVTVIISLLFGGALFGLVGVVLAIPAASFLKVIVQDYYIESRWYKETD
jgi:predicted PurR-regulated permease PerM